MNWFRLLLATVLLAGAHVWAGPEEDYLAAYQMLEEADALEANNSLSQARARYTEIEQRLQKIKETYPSWNSKTVEFRLEYVSERLKKLGGPIQQQQQGGAKTPTPAVTTPQRSAADPTAELRAQVTQLQEERRVLQAKLQEALAAQPAAVDPRELQKAEEQIKALQKEKELLRVALEQEQGKVLKAADKSGLEDAQKEIAKLRGELAAASAPVTAMERELTAARDSARTNSLAVTALQQALKDVKAERDAVLSRAAAADRAAASAPQVVPTKPTGDLNSQVKQLEKERDDALKALNSANRELYETRAKVEKTTGEKENRQLTVLRARLEALEARKVPYTQEELALFKKPELSGKTPPARSETKKKELPAGAGVILTDAQRAFARKDYKTAEQGYLKVLAMDDRNVFTLGNLGAIQMEMERLDEAEKTLTKAVGIEPNDGFVLSMLGILRFRQNKFDEALDLLSRAVEADPRNHEAYNYLGITLAQKGQREAAENALRKSLELAPNYAEGHHNLAVIYATQQPPFLELARYHYQKATSLGYPRNEEFEKKVSKK